MPKELTSVKVYRDPSLSTLLCQADTATVVATTGADDYFRIRLMEVEWTVQEDGSAVHPSTYLKRAPHADQRFTITAKNGGRDVRLSNRLLYWVRGVTPTQEEEDQSIFKYDLEFQADEPARADLATGVRSVGITGRKPIGRSLHIGLDEVDANHYGNVINLKGAWIDATSWITLSLLFKYKSFFLTYKPGLKSTKPTREKVKSHIEKMAKELQAGDSFLLTYSGHGARLKSTDYFDIPCDEENGYNEAWCLYDGLLFDAELFELWTLFRPGVNIIAIIDCCYSGGYSPGSLSEEYQQSRLKKQANGIVKTENRYIQESGIKSLIEKNYEFYENIITNLESKAKLNFAIKAHGVLLTACAEDEHSRELHFYDDDLKLTDAGGALTIGIRQALIEKKNASYQELLSEIIRRIAIVGQTPQLSTFGTEDDQLYSKNPFAI